MILLKITILLFIFIIIPLLLGKLISYRDQYGIMDSVAVKYILGLFASYALFWVLCVPMTLMNISFTALVITYSVCLVPLCCAGIYAFYREYLSIGLTYNGRDFGFKRSEMLYLIVFLFLLGIQIYFALFYESTIWSADDCEYVVRATDTISSNHMYQTNIVTGAGSGFDYKRVLNSWEIYTAYLAKISGFHVTSIAHTVMPVFFLMIAYLVYIYISRQLFKEREDQLIFLCILSITFMFGLYSPYSLTFRLLVTLWQGKAILSAIVIPFLIVFLPKVYVKRTCGRICIYLALISITACSLTMMGSGMVIMVYCTMLVIMSAYKKKICGICYCFCGCLIPAIQLLLYLMMR